MGALRKWARDVSARREDVLVQNCWTYPRSYIRHRYLGPGADALSKVMSQSAQGATGGLVWSGQELTVSVPWSEGHSDYVCPQVHLASDDNLAPDGLVAYRVKRFILREQGRPVNVNDTAADYGMLCEVTQGEIRDVALADPADITVEDRGRGQWTVRAGNVNFDVRHVPGMSCIYSASARP